jgi:hypothetical protein
MRFDVVMYQPSATFVATTVLSLVGSTLAGVLGLGLTLLENDTVETVRRETKIQNVYDAYNLVCELWTWPGQ